MLLHLMIERLALCELPRVPEPALIMNDPAQVDAFIAGGREDGILAPIYLFHAVQSAPLILPGDKVLDLACGPANQLVQIARLNPDTKFIGVDASQEMLCAARITMDRCHVGNVDLKIGNMTNLSEISDGAMDCVICTMSLHHLPNLDSLSQTIKEIRRVLKPGGGLYLADFGRLKRIASQEYFSNDRREFQSAQFTQDFLHSLKAAFSIKELSDAISNFGEIVSMHRTLLAPFMVVITSGNRRILNSATREVAREIYFSMNTSHRNDFNNLARWFSYSGYDLPCTLQ